MNAPVNLRLLAVLVAVGLAGPARANPWDVFGAGSRGSAMAGALSTLSDDGFAAYYNPAALVLDPAATLTIGYAGAATFLTAEVTDFGTLPGTFPGSAGLESGAARALIERAFDAAADVNNISELTIAATLPFRRLFPALQRELTLAVGIGIPSGGTRITNSVSPSPEEPFMTSLGTRNDRLEVMLGLGGEILPGKLSVGVGLLALHDTDGTLAVRAPVAAPSAGAPAASQASLRASLDTDVAFNAGVLWTPTDWIRVALTFRDEQRIDAHLNLDVATLVDGALVTVPYVLEAGLFFVPRQFLLGLSGKPHRRVTVALDTAFLQSSRLAEASPIASLTVAHTSESDPYRVTTPPAPTVKARDVFVVRTGVEVEAIDQLLHVRAGYAYQPSMLRPDQAHGNLLLDNDRHVGSLGVSLSLGPAGALRRPLILSTHVESIVSAARVQQVGVPGTDGAGSVRTRGWSIGGGVTATFQF